MVTTEESIFDLTIKTNRPFINITNILYLNYNHVTGNFFIDIYFPSPRSFRILISQPVTNNVRFAKAFGQLIYRIGIAW